MKKLSPKDEYRDIRREAYRTLTNNDFDIRREAETAKSLGLFNCFLILLLFYLVFYFMF